MFCIYSLKYIDEGMKNVKRAPPIFMITFFLYDKSEETYVSPSPRFSPNLETENEPHFFGLIKSLLDDIVDMGLYMERIDKNYPPYNVNLYS